MKKLLLALGLISVMGLAQAQSSNIQIYGIIDQSIINQSGSGLNATNMNSTTTIPTNIGFRGKEDLGGGNKVGFDLNTGVNLNNGNVGSPSAGVGGTNPQNGYDPQLGTSTLFYRAANIQFENADVGTFKLGRQATPVFMQSWTADALSTTSGGISIATVLTGAGPYGGNGALTGNFRTPANPDINQSNINGDAYNYSNGIGYYSPRWNGFKVNAMLGINNSSSTTAGGSPMNSQAQQQIVVDYESGPYTASAGYSNVLDNTGANLFATTLLSAGYTWNKLTFKGTYMNTTYGKCNQNTGGGNCQYLPLSISSTGTVTPTLYAPIGTAYGADFDAYALGVSYAATDRLRLVAQYTAIADQVTSGNKIGMSTLYADYAFSKRTSIYTMASLVNNQGAANAGPFFGSPTRTPSNGQDVLGVAVGMRHAF